MTTARLLDDWGSLLDVARPAPEQRPASQPAPPVNLIKPDIVVVAEPLRAMPVKVSPGPVEAVIESPVDPLHEARASLFRDKGVSTTQAERLADILAERDHTLDDRRACLECASLHDGRCLQGRYPIGEATIYTLHRCAGFKPDEVSYD